MATNPAERKVKGRVRVRLRIDEGAAELHALPWELLSDPHQKPPIPLAASPLTPFSRYITSEGVGLSSSVSSRSACYSPSPIREICRPTRIPLIANGRYRPCARRWYFSASFLWPTYRYLGAFLFVCFLDKFKNPIGYEHLHVPEHSLVRHANYALCLPGSQEKWLVSHPCWSS